ncbi:MAG TPA: ABC transporter permease [Gammaproteobacteria bacterium]|nr:ABC transporter permease [Gammaproteobacteria bacterium]
MKAGLLRIFAILGKETLQLRRDRLTFGMIVGIPLIQIILFGYAINTDVRHLRAAVADQAHTQLSRRLIEDVQASQVLDIVTSANTGEELKELLDSGKIHVGLLIPPDYERRMMQPDRPAVQLLVDGTDPVILSTARGLATMPRTGPHGREQTAGIFEFRNYYNPERRSSVFVVPALAGVILTMTMVLFTAVAIVRERERGNLELLINTPVRSGELMVGKVLPYILIGLIQVSLILILGHLLFNVPVNGDLLDVYLAALAFITANLMLGLVISTLAKTQFQAMQMTFFFFLPSILLSGFMFPFDGMPKAAQYIAEILPLTHFVRLIRGIVLRGAELGQMMPDLYALFLFAALTLLLAVTRFKKRLG